MSTRPTLAQAARYTTRSYVPGRYDCADLAIDVQLELFGRRVTLPCHPRRRAEQDKAVVTQRDAVSTRLNLAAGEQAETGCAVLMRALDGSWHIGTLFHDASGQPWVLHAHSTALGVLLQPLPELAALGLTVEEYRTWM
ncbi:hypothetical protein ACLBKS_08120 [Hylemonella sp. W303a]|uniref:hypothetical protein n=1 Tax=Hylemonella sp. W303a TaxID=3389873 RepID=UPI00396B3A2F